MAYSQYNTYTAFGVKSSVNLDPSVSPFNATVGLAITSGTASYGIQYSLASPNTSDANATWFNDANLAPGQTAGGTTNYAFPVTRVRLALAQLSAGGSVDFTVLQGFTSL